jgi:hypothetical protein
MSLCIILFSLFCILLPIAMISVSLNINTTHCPNESNHTRMPEGYVERSMWATNMLRKYKQLQCKKCGLWAIWKPK